MSIEQPFIDALPSGWTVAVDETSAGWTVRATHRLYGDATIGPKRKLVPRDVQLLRSRVDDVEAPRLTYSQWLAAGARLGFIPKVADSALTRALRLLAICIDRGDVDPTDVAQACFRSDDYKIIHPTLEASSFGRNVSELLALLGAAATEYGYSVPGVNQEEQV